MKRKIVIITLIYVFIVTFFSGCSIKTPKEYFETSSIKTESNSAKDESDSLNSVTISIRCDTILKNMDQLDESLIKLIPNNGIILENTKIGISSTEADTAYTVLVKVTKKQSLLLNTTGSGDSTYISGINGIKEYSCGELSGWKYKVNGEFPGVGCATYQLKDRDVIEFLYTCDLGADLE